MQPERWQDCVDIFSAVVERPHNARAAFLDQRCDGDKALRREVELLLKHHDESGDFIAMPAFVVAPELLVDDPGALVGQQLGPYRIESVLGSGGMGVVYLAFDERLERKVGLKLLSQSLLADNQRWERLKREARTASVLNHPNIMTIHEVAEIGSTQYIAAEYIEGKTLRKRIAQGPILPNDAIDVAIQVAKALSVAHSAGIVHRDVKPENIMLRPDGYVKVLDFGIAKFAHEETFAVTKTSGTQATTERGKILGTVRYISPEQAGQRAVDGRSDLWSLGVILYEMLTAHPPFVGETPSEVITAVLRKQPQPVHELASAIPRSLQAIIDKALQKDPAHRYQTADEMLADLFALKERSLTGPDRRTNHRSFGLTARWIGITGLLALFIGLTAFFGWRDRTVAQSDPPVPMEKGIAVLPFENLSLEKADAFFADGVQDDVLTSIGKIKDLKVIARASVMDYRHIPGSGRLREIGRALGVSHVLEGSVRRSNDRVVVNVALTDTRDERQVWSDRYERTLTDAVSLQGELAIEIARALQAKLTPDEVRVAGAKPTQNAEAYLLYLRAREISIRDPKTESQKTAVDLYQKAVDLDPNFALARARLSLCINDVAHEYADAPQLIARTRARKEAEEALRLRPDLGEARLAVTHCYIWQDKDYDRALLELSRAAELLPNSAEVPLAEAFIYKQQNKYRERLTALRRAEELDPRSRKVIAMLNMTLRWVRDWPEAIQAFDRGVAVEPDTLVDGCWWIRATDEFRIHGDINALKKPIADRASGRIQAVSDWLNVARYETAMFERNYVDAERTLSAISPEILEQISDEGNGHSKKLCAAFLAVARNSDGASKKRILEEARTELQDKLVYGRFGYADDKVHAELALIHAFLGNKEEAIREAKEAVAISPHGVIENSYFETYLALVYAHTNEPEKAIDLVERLLTVPTELGECSGFNMTLNDLKWGWQWDPLRNNPRFQKILASPEPKTVY